MLKELKNKKQTPYEEIVKWLKVHKGKMPQSGFSEDGKALTRKNMTEDQLEEIRLYQRWYHCQERKILDEYTGIQIEEVPEEFREKIRVLRSYGLGKTPYEEIIKWLEENEGKMPQSGFSADSKALTRKEMTEEQIEEVRLYQRWSRCQEKEILDKYAGRPIEEVPEEYREKIAKLRILIVQGKVEYDELIKWLEEHDGKMPRAAIYNEGRKLIHEEMTEEQLEEVRLYQRWSRCLEKEILDKYEERPIREVPEEYRERIIKLRRFIEEGKTTYKEIIKWIEEHGGKMPRGQILINGKKLKHGDMTEEQLEEVNLYNRWNRCSERKVLDEYAGRPIEEVPKEYREKIAILRKLIVQENTAYYETIKWLEEHKGKMPRSALTKDGILLTRREKTEEQIKEKNLYARWIRCPEKKVLDEYAGRPIEEVPEEYREKIARLRELGQLGTKKDDKIKNRMKRAVAKQVENNKEVRQELEEDKKELAVSDGIEPYNE